MIAGGRTGVRPYIVNQRIKRYFYAEWIHLKQGERLKVYCRESRRVLK